MDLVEYKSKSEGNRFILSVIDHLKHFPVLIPIKSKEAAVVVRHLLDRVFSVFGPPETLHSDQEKDFENQLVKELQSVFGYKKTRTAAYRSQGNSVLERVHSTVHNMLAMYSNLPCDNWAELLPLCNSRTTLPTPKLWRRHPTILSLVARLLSLSNLFSKFLLLMHRSVN